MKRGGQHNKEISIKNILNRKLLGKYILHLLNSIICSILCVIIFTIFAKMPLDYYFYGFIEILILSIVAFIFSIFPQILLTICITFLRKKLSIHIIPEVIIRTVLGFIMSVIVLSYFPGGIKVLEEVICYGYNVYVSFIISGLVFMFVKYRINKTVNC